jgi:hypothetical protein
MRRITTLCGLLAGKSPSKTSRFKGTLVLASPFWYKLQTESHSPEATEGRCEKRRILSMFTIHLEASSEGDDKQAEVDR